MWFRNLKVELRFNTYGMFQLAHGHVEMGCILMYDRTPLSVWVCMQLFSET